MGRSSLIEAIVLQSFDVGEADRFLILLTRERGRIAARAPGVRRLKSRMGGALLPFSHLTIDMKEHGSGWFISGVSDRTMLPRRTNIAEFLVITRCAEALLSLLHDEGAVPEIFDLTLALMQRPALAPHHVFTFTLRLFHLLGVLPERSHAHFAAFSPAELAFAERSIAGEWPDPDHPMPNVRRLCETMTAEHASRSQRTPQIILACQ